MQRFSYKQLFLIYIFFIILLNTAEAAHFNNINKTTSLTYHTHILSYKLSVDELINFETKKNFVAVSAGSISSNEFAHYRKLNFEKTLNSNFKFGIDYLNIENPDIDYSYQTLNLSYIFTNQFNAGISADVNRYKEKNDIGAIFEYKINSEDFIKTRILFKNFQHNSKSENANIIYIKYPAIYEFTFLKTITPAQKNFLKVILQPESTIQFHSDTLQSSSYYNFDNYYISTIDNKFSERIIYNFSLDYSKEFLSNQFIKNYMKSLLFKQSIEFERLKFAPDFNITINYFSNQTRLFSPTESQKLRQRIFTPEIEYLQFSNKTSNLKHIFYQSFIKLNADNFSDNIKLYSKYKIAYQYYFLDRSNIILSLSVEKRQSDKFRFGGGFGQITVYF